jgi:Predicted phosphatase/phosphohexomutase
MIEVEGLAIRAVAFDMDGLMFDSERIAIGLWRAAGLSEGWEIPDPLLLGLVGHSSAEEKRLLVRSLGPEFPYDKVQARRLFLEAGYYRDNPIPPEARIAGASGQSPESWRSPGCGDIHSQAEGAAPDGKSGYPEALRIPVMRR